MGNMKGDSCSDDNSRDRNRDKGTHLGNNEEVKLTRLGSGLNLRCVGAERG